MSIKDTIRAWKDQEFRNSLSADELAQLPENPAGLIELSEAEMKTVAGGHYILSRRVWRHARHCRRTRHHGHHHHCY